MCLPVPLLKTYGICGAIMLLVASLGLMGATIYAFVVSDIFIDPNSSMQKGILITLLIGQVLLIVGAVSGIVGTRKGNACLLFLFSIVVLLFIGVFAGVGIAANFIPVTMFGNDSCTNPDQSWLQTANKAYLLTQLLCTPVCPCSMNNYAGYSIADNISLNLLHPSRNASNGVVRVQQCAGFKTVADQIDTEIYKMADGFGVVEQMLGCSGWCPTGSDNIIHFFSNVNDGRPSGYCYPKLKNYVDKYSNVVMGVCLGFTVFLALVILGNFCLCCHPDRKNIHGISRFIVVDNNQGYNAFSGY